MALWKIGFYEERAGKTMRVQIRDDVAHALRIKRMRQEEKNQTHQKQAHTKGSYPDTVTYSWMPKGTYFDLAGQG